MQNIQNMQKWRMLSKCKEKRCKGKIYYQQILKDEPTFKKVAYFSQHSEY